MPMDRDEDGRPLIHKMSARIGDLEHRLDFLERSFDPDRKGDGRTRILGEIWAIKAALIVMRYHQMEVGGELSVVLALERLVKVCQDDRVDLVSPEAYEALEHAERVLKELDR